MPVHTSSQAVATISNAGFKLCYYHRTHHICYQSTSIFFRYWKNT